MGLQTSGAISMGDVAVELGLSATTNLTLDDSRVRKLAGKETAGSTIGMSDLLGKSNFTYTLTHGSVYTDYDPDEGSDDSYYLTIVSDAEFSLASLDMPVFNVTDYKGNINGSYPNFETGWNGQKTESNGWTRAMSGKNYIVMRVITSAKALNGWYVQVSISASTTRYITVKFNLTLSNGVVVTVEDMTPQVLTFDPY